MRRIGLRILRWAAVGWLVPVMTHIAVHLVDRPASLLATLGFTLGKLFSPGDNLFLVGAFNAVPFALLAAFDEISIGLSPRLGTGVHRISTLVLGVLLTLVTASTTGAVWHDLFGPGRPSSTAVIAFLTVPIFASMGVGAFYFVRTGFLVLAAPATQARGGTHS